MASGKINLIQIGYCRGNEKIIMGRLASKDRKIFFEYDPLFLELGLELSPFKLPLKAGLVINDDPLFDGLFGIFNDSLPDGWGRLLLDRKLAKSGINPGSLTPLDRLQHVGHRGLGALFYEPELEPIHKISHLDLDEIADECHQFQEHDDEQFIEDLLVMNGSSAGARPKILVSIINHSLEVTDNKSIKEDWIIKFRSSLDPKDVGPIEFAYHLMAKEAGLDVPEAKLFKSKNGSGFFGVQRFDHKEGKFYHMHTLSGLLHVDHRLPSLDYETIMKATLWLTKDVRECEKLFRQAVFNVLSHNRDDHAKNFSFLMDENGTWKLSPAYDLIFSSGPAGEHCTTLMGEGKHPELTHFLKLAEVASIPKQNAMEIIAQVKNAISKWKKIANESGVTSKSSSMIQFYIKI